MQNLGLQQSQQSEVMREIAGKLWRCPVARIREGMREANINGMTKVLLIKTPAGLVTASFMTSKKKLGIMIKSLYPGYFYFEIPNSAFIAEENQDKELNAIAKMFCDWQG
jgi:hypothetical protein